MAEPKVQTGAALLVARMRDFGVRHVFGYPGGPLTPLYDALYRQPEVRHILARDEQAAAFMADGHARASGMPGVCLAVSGPGVYNAATPLATSYSDSVPALLISGQVPPNPHGARSGYYHENNQLAACSHFTKWQVAVNDPNNLVSNFDRAWLTMTEGRPGPVLFDVPGEVLRAEVQGGVLPSLPTLLSPRPPKPNEIEALVKLIAGWRRPLILAGGGVISARAEPELAQLAGRLGAPVFHSLMGKCALSYEHPLSAGLPWTRGTSDARDMTAGMSPLFGQADGLLAIGCRFTQVTTGTWGLRLPPSVAQIDIDSSEFGRHYPVTLGVRGDARPTLRALLSALPQAARTTWAPPPTPRAPWLLSGMDLSAAIRRALPRDAIVVADVTQLAYRMIVDFPVYSTRTFLHPAAFVAMGYALPAALGAKAALPQRTVVAVMGDGGFQMTAMELATAVQEKLPIVVVLVNDHGLTLIRALQQRRYEGRLIGVDLKNPDFGLFAKSFGVGHWAVDSETGLEKALTEAIASGETALVEVRLPAGSQ